MLTFTAYEFQLKIDKKEEENTCMQRFEKIKVKKKKQKCTGSGQKENGHA